MIKCFHIQRSESFSYQLPITKGIDTYILLIHIFVNHRALFELSQELSEIAKDNKHEDTGRHHSANLTRKEVQRMSRKVKILMLTSIYLSPTDLLSISLMTVSDILNRYI